jgi:hypothetical protein
MRGQKRSRRGALAKSKKKTVVPARTYGWQPDLPDIRDHLYSAPLLRLGPVDGIAEAEIFRIPAWSDA